MRTELPESARDMRGAESRSAAEEQTLLVLGASGDLTARLLLPGLGGLLARGTGGELFLVGSGMDDWDDERRRQRVTESVAAAATTGAQVTATMVLRGVLDDDPTLSVRADSAEQRWRIVEPVLSASREDTVPLLEYPAGSGGPEDSLLATRLPFPAPGTRHRAGA